MNKTLLSIFTLSLGAIFAETPVEFGPTPQALDNFSVPAFKVYQKNSHNLYPRFFFKKHKEGGYNYDMFGFGLGYHYKKDEGLNFKCSVSTNLDGSKPYIEEDVFFGYSIKANDNLNYIPYLASKNATHQINKINGTKYIVSKGSLYAGVGLKPYLVNGFDTEVKLGLSRDLYNILLHSQEDKFEGRKFSNPFGYTCEISVAYQTTDKLNLALDASFARGFKGEFQNYGGGLTANWGF